MPAEDLSLNTRRRWPALVVVAVFGGLVLSLLPTPVMQWSVVSGLDFIGPGVLDVAAAEAPPESDPGAVVVEAINVDSFNMVGLRLPRSIDDRHARLRVRSVGGDWSEWMDAEVPADEGPDPHSAEAEVLTGTVTEPIWVDDADAVQVVVDGEATSQVEVLVVREHLERSVVESVDVAHAAAPAVANGPPIHSRGDWGARAVGGMDIAKSVEMGVVHHTASASSYSEAAVPGIIRGIQAYHIDGRGWSDIGYNYLVDRFGRIWEGRAGGITQNVVGAHAAGFNTGSFGVSVIGSYDETVPALAAVNAVAELIGWRLYMAGHDPAGSVAFRSGGSPKYAEGVTVNLARVIGHRDVGVTGCPGTHLYSRLGEIRSKAKTAYNRYAVHDPRGAVVDMATYPGLVGLGGYAFDPDNKGAIGVDVTVDGRVVASQTANMYRKGSDAVKPGWGDQHGFLVHVPASPGVRRVCVVAKNTGQGRDNAIFCGSFNIPDNSPQGRISGVTAVAGKVTVTGSVSDPDAAGPTEVTTRLGGQPGGVLTDVQPANPGFTVEFDSVPGTHDLCVYAENRNEGSDRTIGCQKVVVRSGPPVGAVTKTTPGKGKIDFSGWALDLDTTSAVQIVVRVGGQPRGTNEVRAWADRPRRGLDASFPGYGDAHGFDVVIPSVPGTHDACVYALNQGPGSDKALSCQRVVVK
ncbi:MAG TPA: N-acetylmuramoyl-L-alanine amidase [Microthrixaceae bacterium]|nr:N-acetylmuramoyl-L-alanine amidase [Microthrixaceae bacterium]